MKNTTEQLIAEGIEQLVSRRRADPNTRDYTHVGEVVEDLVQRHDLTETAACDIDETLRAHADTLPPPLLSSAELAVQRSERLDLTERIMRDAYGDQILRLNRDDDTATLARDYVAGLLQQQTAGALAREQAEGYVRLVAGGGSASPWRVLDVTSDAPTVPVPLLIEGEVYAGMLHAYNGKPGTNKTTRILRHSLELAAQGQHAVLIEYEMGEDAIKRLIDELGFDRSAVREHLHVQAPNHPIDAAYLDELRHEIPNMAFLAIDNLSEAVVHAGGDTNSADDVIRVLGPLRDLAHHQNVGVAVIAHPGHGRGESARGSSAYEQILDVAYVVETPVPVTPDQVGTQTVKCVKDRPARVGVDTVTTDEWGTGDGTRRLPCKRVATPTVRDRWTAEQVAVIDALERHQIEHPDAEGLSQNKTLETAGIAKGEATRNRLSAMANDPLVPVVRDSVEVGTQVQFRYRYEPIAEPDGLDF